jgi:hypothetical protein
MVLKENFWAMCRQMKPKKYPSDYYNTVRIIKDMSSGNVLVTSDRTNFKIVPNDPVVRYFLVNKRSKLYSFFIIHKDKDLFLFWKFYYEA